MPSSSRLQDCLLGDMHSVQLTKVSHKNCARHQSGIAGRPPTYRYSLRSTDTEYLYHDTKQRVVRQYRYKHHGIVTADAKSRALPGSTLWLEP
jgi:hypothetical protein